MKRQAASKKYELVAVLIRNKTIVRIGVNGSKTHPKCRHKKASGVVCRGLHAEQSALLWARPGDKIVVMRFGATGEARMAKPCQECERELRASGIRKCWYTDNNGRFSELPL